MFVRFSWCQIFGFVGSLPCLPLWAEGAPSGAIAYVDSSATGMNNGSGWCDAYTHLQDALAASADPSSAITEIRMAQGVYRPDVGAGQTPGSRTSTFRLSNGLSIRGGFAGCGASDPEERKIDVFTTVLSGDLAGDDTGLLLDPTRSENCYHVMTSVDTDSTALLDGVTVSGGHAEGPTHNSGAGLFNDGGSPTLMRCTFSGNWVWYYGGGIYNRRGANPTLDRCTLVDNVADYGGGINNDGQSKPSLVECVIARNSVGYHGGGVYNVDRSAPVLTDCAITDNQAYYNGGGMANYGNSRPELHGCRLEQNGSRTAVGGGMFNEESSPVLTDVLFRENSAALSGGALYNSSSDPVLRDCVFEANEARNAGGVININSSPELTNCLFERNHAWLDGGALYNLGAGQVALINCTFTRNVAGGTSGGVYNTGHNPALRNCILWNNQDSEGTQEAAQISGGMPGIDYSCIQGSSPGAGGVGNINDDPRFVPGPSGCAYLMQLGAGDPAESPCANASGDTASDLGLESRTTRTDGQYDAGQVDLGYHYAVTGSVCLLGRYQCEARTDLRELARLGACFTGGSPIADECCRRFDLNGNGAVDLVDFDEFSSVLVGP